MRFLVVTRRRARLRYERIVEAEEYRSGRTAKSRIPGLDQRKGGFQ
jgi:hypothetical protein